MAMQPMMGARDPSMNAEDADTMPTEPQEETASEVVCIAAQGDGTFLVYEEGEQGQEQPAKSIDEALEMARQLLQGDSDDPGDPQAYWNELAAKKDQSRGMM